MLGKKEVSQLREELRLCKRPMFFFHDDPDGLASFILLYKFVGEGKGLPVKAVPRITKEIYARKVEEYGADKVFILDIAAVDQDFIDAVKVPVIWLDHHAPLVREHVLYFNPRLTKKVNIPVAYLCWQVVCEERPHDMWAALVGCIGDWYLPEFTQIFSKTHLDLLPLHTRSVGEALFESQLGTLVKVFSFNLKGAMSEVIKSIKIFTRIESPYEILGKQTARGKFVYKKFEKVNVVYQKLLSSALKQKAKDRLFVFTYQEDKLSLTKDLANELLYILKDKVVILGREKADEVRCSLRAPAKIRLLKALEKALVGIEGYGGGHEQACGAAIKKHDFKQFLKNLEKELKLH